MVIKLFLRIGQSHLEMPILEVMFHQLLKVA